MKIDLNDEFLSAISFFGLSLKDEQLRGLEKFWEILSFWNQRINLVSVKTRRDFYLIHLLDSLVPLSFMPPKEFSLLDLGTGAGLPGIPIKLCRPEIHLTLVEASRRRSSFLREAVRQLCLSSVKIINDRVENILSRGNEPLYSVVISRATWSLEHYLSLGSPFLAPRGKLIALKGLLPAEEMEKALQFIENTDIIFVGDHDVTLPHSPRKRRVLVFQKASNIR